MVAVFGLSLDAVGIVGMGLQIFEIGFEVEDRFGIEFTFESLLDCKTFGDLVDVVFADVQSQQPDRGISKNDVEAYLKLLLIDKYSIKPVHLSRDANLFSRELGLAG